MRYRSRANCHLAQRATITLRGFGDIEEHRESMASRADVGKEIGRPAYSIMIPTTFQVPASSASESVSVITPCLLVVVRNLTIQ